MNDAASGGLPTQARVVVIGGGVGGASIAYHLAELGETDVVLLERAELTSGSTFHSAGLVGQLRADPTLTRMNMYSVELYRRLQQTEHAPGWIESGGIKLASTPERLEEIRRQISWAQTYDLPLHEISPDEARDRFPLMSTEGVVGACFLDSDGQVDPSQLCMALAALARAAGVTIRTHTRVTAIETVEVGPSRLGQRRVAKVQTDRGDIACEVVVDAAGMFAAEIARMVDVRVPIVPMSHQYVVTEPCLADAGLPSGHPPLPSLRDPDLLVYFRQEVEGLVMGGYERNPAAWSASETSYDAIPPDFNGRLLPEAWERFEEIATNATIRVPAMADVGMRSVINGPEGFTPDNEFCLGETSVAGFFVAAGFCAHGIAGAGGIGKVMAEWVVDGEPEFDLWHMDIGRFGAAYASPAYTLARTTENYQTYYDIAYPGIERQSGRPLRMSPAYPWHRRARCGASARRPAGSGSTTTRRTRTRRSRACGRTAGPDVTGRRRPRSSTVPRARRPGCSTRRPSPRSRSPGRTRRASSTGSATTGSRARSTRSRTPRRSTRAAASRRTSPSPGSADDRFLVVTGTAYGTHDLAWLRKQARLGACDVTLDGRRRSRWRRSPCGDRPRATSSARSPTRTSRTRRSRS